jgi:hypothetical protein
MSSAQEALGHKSIAMTVRYSHLSPDFLQDAVDRLAPPQEEEPAENRTDTTRDTSGLEAMETESQVGALTIVRSVTYTSRTRP